MQEERTIIMNLVVHYVRAAHALPLGPISFKSLDIYGPENTYFQTLGGLYKIKDKNLIRVGSLLNIL